VRAIIQAFVAVSFLAIFGMVNGQDDVTTGAYGVLWHTLGSSADSQPFVELTGLAYLEPGILFTVDRDLGVLKFDAFTGALVETIPNAFISKPSDVAVDAVGRLYVSDLDCSCIFILNPDSTWQADTISGFGEAAPMHIAVSSGGVLYATDVAVDGAVIIKTFASDAQMSTEFNTDLSSQPHLLFNDSNVLLVLDDDGRVFALSDEGLRFAYAVADMPVSVNAVAVDGNNNLFLATQSRGLVIYDTNGAVIGRAGRIAAGFPIAGEVVSPRGVAVSADGTVYLADSDGTFGAVTAFVRASGRTTGTALDMDVAVMGFLNDESPSQDWHFDATRGQRVTISAIANNEDEQLDVALRIITPVGEEEAFNDDHRGSDLVDQFDARLPDHIFAFDGEYTIRVELIAGEGTYSLGITQPRPFQLAAGNVTLLNGEISDIFPTQQWVFQGRAGQVFTITMQAQNDDLDTIIRLLDPQNNVIAENDDAFDPELGFNSQLVQVTLPTDGAYTIEAARFSGQGAYSLVIVATS